MPFDPTKRTQTQRLVDAVAWSYNRKLKPFREKRTAMVKQYVGANFSDDGAPVHVPVNLLEMMCSIFVRLLAARAPQVMVTTTNRELKTAAWDFEHDLNKHIRKLQVEQVFKRAVLDAMFSIGVARVAVDLEGEVAVELIDLDDFVMDMSASSIGRSQYIGNFYEMPYSELMDADYLNKKAKERLSPLEIGGGQDGLGERAQKITTGSDTQDEDSEWKRKVRLLDVYLPDERLVLTMFSPTFSAYDLNPEPLRIIKWKGPDMGPYHTLGFIDVPTNPMPLSPMANSQDLHELGNNLFRKLEDQAKRQKKIGYCHGGADKDGNRIVQTGDGEMIRLDNPRGVGELNMGGIDPQAMAFFMQVRELFMSQGGNLYSLGGLGAQTDTVGQEQLVSMSASKRASDMQDRTMTFTKGVVEAIGYYRWADPVMSGEITQDIPGREGFLTTPYGAEDRLGSFEDYDITIQPYSMTHMTPSMKLGVMRQTIQEMAPFMGLLQKEGITLNLEAYLDAVAKWSDVPELRDVFTLSGEREAAEVAETHAPAVTNRIQTRVNRQGASPQSQASAMIANLQGQGQQPAERERAFTPVS